MGGAGLHVPASTGWVAQGRRRVRGMPARRPAARPRRAGCRRVGCRGRRRRARRRRGPGGGRCRRVSRGGPARGGVLRRRARRRRCRRTRRRRPRRREPSSAPRTAPAALHATSSRLGTRPSQGDACTSSARALSATSTRTTVVGRRCSTATPQPRDRDERDDVEERRVDLGPDPRRHPSRAGRRGRCAGSPGAPPRRPATAAAGRARPRGPPRPASPPATPTRARVQHGRRRSPPPHRASIAEASVSCSQVRKS